MNAEQELQLGIEAQRGGRLGDAVRHYRQVLAFDPRNVDALNLMSSVALAAGDPATAAALATSATEEQPDWFVSWLNLGNALGRMERSTDAIAALRRAVALNPQSAEAHVNLSAALNRSGEAAEAADIAVQAIIIAPGMPEAHTNFGNALLALGSPGEAIEAYDKATKLQPDGDLAWFNMGNAFMELGSLDAAIDCFTRSIALADAAYKRFNLGNALAQAIRLDEAILAQRAAIALDPGLLDARINLAAILRDCGRLDEAEATLRDALALAPDESQLHWNLALVLLTKGDYAEGWREYEWRWRTPYFATFVRRFAAPPWQGEDLAGRSLLVSSEQGFGDAIEMARYIPRLAERAAHVVVECRPGLGRLFSTLGPRVEVIEAGTRPLPVTDLQVAMMSLPYRFGTEIGTVPAACPYLAPPTGALTFPAITAAEGVKVGVVWSGSANRSDNRVRSFRAHDLTALPGAKLFSLQKGDAAADASDLFDHGRLIDLGPELRDFADTAAAIVQLDLVITADTAVAHLAGALGKPVWIVLGYPCAAFLWMTGRDDSPWYPSARLFRQTRPGDWSEVMAQLRQAFAKHFRG